MEAVLPLFALAAGASAASSGSDPAPFSHQRLELTECGKVEYQGPWTPNGPKGHISLGDFNMCMDNGEPFGGEGSVVQVYECHPLSDDEVNQSWNVTDDGLIIALQEGSRCISADENGQALITSACDQKWDFKDGTFVHQATGKCLTARSPGAVIALPRLNIIPGAIYSQGGSSGGDMAIQFHVAFSKHVSGVCGNDAQPYHCAVTRFPGDFLLPQTNESSVPHCYGCPDGYTVLYDKCKNHPQFVDVGMLPDYPRRVCGDGGKPGCIDDAANIYDDYVYLSRGECRTYIGGAEVNTLAMYGMMTTDPETQLKYIDKCATENVDDDKECMEHVLRNSMEHLLKKPMNPPVPYATSSVKIFDMMPFIEDHNIGFEGTGFAYIPNKCYNTSNACQIMVREPFECSREMRCRAENMRC
uniref:Ricin B lectin domain-containing protein n=1 Tax=Lotharella globosa TaxID=91324 RepID=A0A7S3YI88_9EUKA